MQYCTMMTLPRTFSKFARTSPDVQVQVWCSIHLSFSLQRKRWIILDSELLPQVSSPEKLEAACQVSSQYQLLHKTVNQGVSNNSQDWDMQIKDYFVHRHALSTLGSVVLLYDRPLIPQALHQDILEHLHAGHAGCNMMFSRASSCLYWPHYREDINKFQANCKTD